MLIRTGVAVFAALLLIWQAGWATGNYPGNAVRVNGVDISYQRFMGFYQEYQRSQGVAAGARGDQLAIFKRMRKEAMDMVIDQELLKQAAEADKIEVSQEEIDAAWTEVSEPFENVDEFQRRIEGEGYTEESYRKHLQRMIAASKYLDQIRAPALDVSDEELEAYLSLIHI